MRRLERPRMLLRPATPADGPAVAALHQRSILELCAGHYTEVEVADWTAVLAAADYGLLLANGGGVVATIDDRIAGFGLIDSESGIVNAVYIHPERARRGVGLAILRSLEEMARRAGRVRVTLHATLNAVGFYDRAGYSNDGAGTNELPSGAVLSCVRMSKALRSDPR